MIAPAIAPEGTKASRALFGIPERSLSLSATAIILVLLAAFSHAAWNLLAKRLSGFDAVAYLWLTGVCSIALYAPLALAVALAVRPHYGWAQLGFTVGSGVLHLAYFLLLQRGYRSGDLSLVYPLARGTGPMLSSLAAVLFFGERPGAWGAAGILLVGAGVFALGLPENLPDAGPSSLTAVWFGLATGMFIAMYTLWDKHAVSALGIPPLVYDWGSGTVRAMMLTPFALQGRRRDAIHTLWTNHRPFIFTCAALMPLSYILVLTALRFSDVSAIAPAREISVLIGVGVGGRLLAEGRLRRRLIAAAAIAGGVVAIAIG
jgi:drug/metabolite transporter (DMT)-like permease